MKLAHRATAHIMAGATKGSKKGNDTRENDQAKGQARASLLRRRKDDFTSELKSTKSLSPSLMLQPNHGKENIRRHRCDIVVFGSDLVLLQITPTRSD